MTQLSNGKFPYCGNAFYSIHLRSVSRLICFPSQFLSLLISLHSGGWENSRKLCKPETQSWVCITCLNSEFFQFFGHVINREKCAKPYLFHSPIKFRVL